MTACEYYQQCVRYSVTMCTEDVEKCHQDEYVAACEERKRIILGVEQLARDMIAAGEQSKLEIKTE
jgi:hypothetical protein